MLTTTTEWHTCYSTFDIHHSIFDIQHSIFKLKNNKQTILKRAFFFEIPAYAGMTVRGYFFFKN